MNFKPWLITLCLLSLALFSLYQYKQLLMSPNAAEQHFEPAATVDAVTVSSISFQKKVQVNGEIKAIKQLELKNELAGKIIKLNLISGSKVFKDQILIEIQHTQEKAQLIAANAQLTLTKNSLTRYKTLKESNEVSQELVDNAESGFATAQSNVILLQDSIAKKIIKAPFDAVVGINELELGQYLDSNTSITTLVGVNDFIWVDFSLPQTYDDLAVNTEVMLSKVGSDELPVRAEVIAINPSLSANSRHLKYRAKVLKSTLPLRPNTLVNVSVPVSASKQQIAIPDLALTHDQFGDYVFVLQPQDDGSYRAKRQKVIVLVRVAEQAIISSGLQNKQIVATDGAFKLQEGMKVFINKLIAD
ncbi:efflux RND transporter periplasmic adaptor subunit [Thalassotalea psychrophila]|uniref:Efflux RND transporter periplasmic adaptor subunit n=1 Tax=Thalassotalea psychrophila TaxID=3065647 RepID=A0ABY9TRZ6_9GAMM|nr:efflux RND transporter periplasmic adaptor subunit [Colwelliaceae bacterium SQ149]